MGLDGSEKNYLGKDIFIMYKCYKHTSSFGAVDIGSWAGVGEEYKRAGKEAAIFPDLKIYNGFRQIKKTIWGAYNVKMIQTNQNVWICKYRKLFQGWGRGEKSR